jgi:GntR family transcriptional repressor for pyruvate dehydrogenase complex
MSTRAKRKPSNAIGNGDARPGPDASTRPARGCIAIGPSGAVTRPLKTSETVARDVVKDIIARGLQPGESLPPEAAMLEKYSVSRESLREGLRLVEVQGLISIRRGPGGGPIVGHVDPANLGRISTLYYHMAGATYEELFEAWIVAEAIIAERAARNPDSRARVNAMAPYLEGNGHSAPEDLEKFVDMHTGFHAAIAALLNNRVIELTFMTMGTVVTHHSTVVDDPRTLRDLIADDHLKLAKAIAAGHANRARQVMEDHVSEIARISAQRMGVKVKDYIEWL